MNIDTIGKCDKCGGSNYVGHPCLSQETSKPADLLEAEKGIPLLRKCDECNGTGLRPNHPDHVAEVERLTNSKKEALALTEQTLEAAKAAGMELIQVSDYNYDFKNTRAELAESKLSQLQERGGKLCCWIGNAMMLGYDAKRAIAKLPANFDMPHSLKLVLKDIQELATDKFGKEVVQLSNEEKARKIADELWPAVPEYAYPKILAILNGGQQ